MINDEPKEAPAWADSQGKPRVMTFSKLLLHTYNSAVVKNKRDERTHLIGLCSHMFLLANTYVYMIALQLAYSPSHCGKSCSKGDWVWGDYSISRVVEVASSQTLSLLYLIVLKRPKAHTSCDVRLYSSDSSCPYLYGPARQATSILAYLCRQWS